MIEIELPYPPSANRIWRNGRNAKTGKPMTFRSQAYKRWVTDAGWLLKPQMKGLVPLDGPFVARMIYSRAKRRANADVDNRGKVVLDLLQKHGVIANDCKAEKTSTEWGDAPMGCRVILTPYTPD